MVLHLSPSRIIIADSAITPQGLAIPFVNPRIPLASTAHTRQMPMPPLLGTFLRVGFFGCFFCTLLQAFGFL
jgi:hypothetical protein